MTAGSRCGECSEVKYLQNKTMKILWCGSGGGNYVFRSTSALSDRKPHRKLQEKWNSFKQFLTKDTIPQNQDGF
jgi:hypothetical protein